MVQALLDLVGCWLLAELARRQLGERAGLWVLGLACLCPFTAEYAATGLTESLSVLAVSVALFGFGRLAEDGFRAGPGLWTLAGGCALAMLLRPDGALVMAAGVVALLRYSRRIGAGRSVRLVLLLAVLAALPLAPWTIRNARTFHVFQPLAPKHVNDPGEPVNLGVYRWIRSWSVDYTSTGDVFWHIGQERLDLDDLPARAFDSAAERDRTAALLDRYNEDKFAISPALDAQFDALAQARIQHSSARYYIWLPALRMADMWLRPRTERVPVAADWWRVLEHPAGSAEAIALGVLNLLLVAAALAGLVTRRLRWVAFAVAYLIFRTLLLGTLENPEPRYSLEAYPIVLLAAGCWLSRLRTRPRPAEQVE